MPYADYARLPRYVAAILFQPFTPAADMLFFDARH